MDNTSTVGMKTNQYQQNKSTDPIDNEISYIFNSFFDGLKVIFPASMAMFKSDSEIKELKKQWIMAFTENGITSVNSISAGMRIARQQSSPFFPSVGQFIEWCRQGLAKQYGLPTKQELLIKFKDYCYQRGLPDFYDFDYESYANYWLINKLYDAMIYENLNNERLEYYAEKLISRLMQKLMNGDVMPIPNLSLSKKKSHLSNKFESLEMLKKIKKKHGLGK